MLKKYADGKVVQGVAEFDQLDRTEKTVEVNVAEVNKRLGTEITIEEVEDILTKVTFLLLNEMEKILQFLFQLVAVILLFLKICWKKLLVFMDMITYHLHYL